MLANFQRLRAERLRGERGFTLVELLVVIVIIGILVAIAIPVFLSQRESAFQRAVESDLRNAAVQLETYYNDQTPPSYPAAFVAVGDGASGADTTPTGLNVFASPNVVLTYSITDNVYTIEGEHGSLEGTWTFTSDTGVITYDDGE